MSKFKSASADLLFSAILNLKSIDECYSFFEDLLSVKEFKDISQRMEVAKLLDENMCYADISKITGASTATISRVSKCLSYGCDGYSNALKRLKNEGGAK